MKKDESEMETSEKGQIWKGQIRRRKIWKGTVLKRSIRKKEQSENDKDWKRKNLNRITQFRGKYLFYINI